MGGEKENRKGKGFPASAASYNRESAGHERSRGLMIDVNRSILQVGTPFTRVIAEL